MDLERIVGTSHRKHSIYLLIQTVAKEIRRRAFRRRAKVVSGSNVSIPLTGWHDSMSLDQEALKITVLSADTKLLHDVAWMLSAVGYSVETTKDFEASALWRRYADCDVLLVDGRAVHPPYEAALAYESHNPVYRILLYDAASAPDFSAWQAAGANDAIGIPVSRGELLTRVRTAARYLEFERRLKRWSATTQLPGVYSRRGFVRKLARLNNATPPRESNHVLLATTIDWYRGIVAKSGQNAGERTVAAAARAIRGGAGDKGLTAYLGDGIFVTLVSCQSAAAAKNIAKRIADDFGSRDSQRDSLGQPTLTTAIVPWINGNTPDELIVAGLETLTIAKQSGGDCILEQGEFSQEHTAWVKEVAEDNPFAGVVAQDIMEFFPAVLTCDADQSDTIAALRRAGVPVCPYVDRNGRLTGVASADATAGALSTNRLAALPIQSPETINNNASFSDIYEAFSSRGCSTLIVVADDHPLGYLTFHGFLSLVEPVGPNTYARSKYPGNNSLQLAVPALSSDCEPS